MRFVPRGTRQAAVDKVLRPAEMATYHSSMSIAEDISQATEHSTGDTIDLTHGEEASHGADLGHDPSGQVTSGRPEFTITDAATACAVSRKTITRKLADLAEHGAAKDEDGIWRIPVEALLAVGLHPGRSVPERRTDGAPRPVGVQAAPAPRVTGPTGQTGPDMITVSRDRWDDLRIRLARAEAQAAERDLALADARLALRALTAGPAPGHVPVGAPQAAGSVAPGAVQVPTVPGAAPAAHTPAAAPAGVAEPSLPPLPGVPAQARAGTGPIPMGSGGTSPMAAPPIDPSADLARARSEAAQTGGYVPAAHPAAKRRRWWQSK